MVETTTETARHIYIYVVILSLCNILFAKYKVYSTVQQSLGFQE